VAVRRAPPSRFCRLTARPAAKGCGGGYAHVGWPRRQRNRRLSGSATDAKRYPHAVAFACALAPRSGSLPCRIVLSRQDCALAYRPRSRQG
jgi:hypothetical protein